MVYTHRKQIVKSGLLCIDLIVNLSLPFAPYWRIFRSIIAPFRLFSSFSKNRIILHFKGKILLLADSPRAVLQGLISRNREDYSSISRLIGRNSAYIQQFIKRGTPRKLAEIDRGILARYFDVDETLLGAPGNWDKATRRLVQIPVYDLSASAGAGSFNEAEAVTGYIGFDNRWLRQQTASEPTSLSLISVTGDSMMPTLFDGDLVLIDCAVPEPTLRDGIYVVRMGETLHVKRVACAPGKDVISLLSDNPIYPCWTGLKRQSVDIVGRVLWFGRNLA
jgi:phage repressor protein C with HTH and peptisase S24 domain